MAATADTRPTSTTAHGKYLLTGGLLKCPTCGGSFEALADRPGRQRGNIICATRRRKPGVCTNTLTLPIVETDNSVLDIVEGEVLASPFIEELLAVVDKGEADDTARLTAERDRLQREIDALLDLVASGVAQTTVAAKIKEAGSPESRSWTPSDADLARRPPNIAKLREALTQRAEEWKTDLRSEPSVARLVLRRLVGPLTLTDPADHTAFIEWAASLTPALLEGLAPVHLLASPRGFSAVGARRWRLVAGGLKFSQVQSIR